MNCGKQASKFSQGAGHYTGKAQSAGLASSRPCVGWPQCQRYWVKRSFEDAKGQRGMADYQVQKWSAWHHHMALVMMAMLFMLEERVIQKERFLKPVVVLASTAVSAILP